ncbi:hypothetical protein [Polaribacter sp. Asnod1-A03]|uniref:hypothetical protein n=1 Tax=Polaribacter sp. Asnod1-A03 TaxID=3160581 RepID=UPI00386C0B33
MKKYFNKQIISFLNFLLEGIIDKKGIDFKKRIYYIKYDKNTCIELTTMLAYSADEPFKKMIENIVYSVIENN